MAWKPPPELGNEQPTNAMRVHILGDIPDLLTPVMLQSDAEALPSGTLDASSATPAFGVMVHALQMQQESIRMQEEHLRAMSVVVDRALTTKGEEKVEQRLDVHMRPRSGTAGNHGEHSLQMRPWQHNQSLTSIVRRPDRAGDDGVVRIQEPLTVVTEPLSPALLSESPRMAVRPDVKTRSLHCRAAPLWEGKETFQKMLSECRVDLAGDDEDVRVAETYDWLTELTGLSQSTELDSIKRMVHRLKHRLEIEDPNSFVSPIRLKNCLKRLGSDSLSLEQLSLMLGAIYDYTSSRNAGKSIFGSSVRSSRGSRLSNRLSAITGMPSMAAISSNGECENMVNFKEFARVIICDDGSRFSDSVRDMLHRCREILIASDANILVAELMQVKVDELAAPVHINRHAKFVEPVVALVIILNAIVIGYQADLEEDKDDNSFWVLLDVIFTTFFATELCIKFASRGRKWFCYGSEGLWNAFDSFIVLLSFVDIVFTSVTVAVDATNLGLVRVIRLMRCTRLFRMFRVRYFKELKLMLKGMIAGTRTLFWGVILLTICIYILAIAAKVTLAGNPPIEVDEDVFRSVPISMFTVFRCFVGECQDARGRPLVYLYANAHGVSFALAYIAATVFIVFGVFNLIFAIYVEATLTSAKNQRILDRTEEVRLARHARELLKKFALAQNLLDSVDREGREAFGETREFRRLLGTSAWAPEFDPETLTVTRDTFLITIRDREVQHLLDAIDVGADRHLLFDIFDADASGGIGAGELIRGLLSVRGEAKKTDTVANLLAVRATQTMIRKLFTDIEELRGCCSLARQSAETESP